MTEVHENFYTQNIVSGKFDKVAGRSQCKRTMNGKLSRLRWKINNRTLGALTYNQRLETTSQHWRHPTTGRSCRQATAENTEREQQNMTHSDESKKKTDRLSVDSQQHSELADENIHIPERTTSAGKCTNNVIYFLKHTPRTRQRPVNRCNRLNLILVFMHINTHDGELYSCSRLQCYSEVDCEWNLWPAVMWCVVHFAPAKTCYHFLLSPSRHCKRIFTIVLLDTTCFLWSVKANMRVFSSQCNRTG